MTANGFTAPAVNALWDAVLPFADYAFIKSHAAGYGLMSYWTAYLKANWRRAAPPAPTDPRPFTPVACEINRTQINATRL